jgi:hypothetical protein
MSRWFRRVLFIKTETYSVPDRVELDGWRCDICGETVTAQERPSTRLKRCSRCSPGYITSIEVWAARPRLGLWTR